MSLNFKEIEIKLYASAGTLSGLRQYALFKSCVTQAWSTKVLFNQYFDTKDHLLTNTGFALRIRQDGDCFIQTLKAKGQSVGGFSARDEYDWLVQANKLDLSVLSEVWPRQLLPVESICLVPLFATDFKRDYALIAYKQACIEVALDQGVVKTEDKQDVISELELELKQGQPDALLELAISLAEVFPLIPSMSSKAERGYRLSAPLNYPLQLKPFSPSMMLQEKVYHYLVATQQCLEYYLWKKQPDVIKIWYQQLQALWAVFNEVSMEPLLYRQLQELIKDGSFIRDDDSIERMVGYMEAELNSTRWGVFSLSVSRWLLTSTSVYGDS